MGFTGLSQPLTSCWRFVPYLLLLIIRIVVSVAATGADIPRNSSRGGNRCGDLVLPFSFHLNSSCSSNNASSKFRLFCDGPNSTILALRLGAATFRILDFLPSGSLLLDYAYAPGAASTPVTTPCDPAYAALSRPSSPAAALDASPFLAVTSANVLRLYACEDSSLCRAGCEDVAASCGGGKSGCCYPLSDGSM